MKNIWVVGSINMDLVGQCPRFVEPGETILGTSFAEFPGGKGANQAVALARLGQHPIMIGALGDDDFGQTYRKIFEMEGVDHHNVRIVPGTKTGVALIEVVQSGENRILVLPGANSMLSPDLVIPILSAVQSGDIVLFQLEIPLETVTAAIVCVKERGGIVVLDPAPAVALSDDLLKHIDFLTPNQTEAQILSKNSGESLQGHVSLEPANMLIRKGVGAVVQKAGKQGAYLVTKEGFHHVPPFIVEVRDTTAAGDSFNAGFAFALAHGKTPLEAIRWGNAVGALSTTVQGAQPGMPTMKQVEDLLQRSMNC